MKTLYLFFAALALGSYVLGCFKADMCDLMVDPNFSMGWCRFRESWRIVRARPSDIEVIPKSTTDMQNIFGKAIKYKKPLLKVSASTGGSTILESRKILVPNAGPVSIEYNVFLEKELTPGYIRVETAGGVILGEHKFQFISKGAWREAVMNFNVPAANQFIVIKIAMMPESGFWTAYFGYIHACYTEPANGMKIIPNYKYDFSSWNISGKYYDDTESTFYSLYGGKYNQVKKVVHSVDQKTKMSRYIDVSEGDCITVSTTTSYNANAPKLVLLVDGVEVESTWKANKDESLDFTGVFKVHESGTAKVVLELPAAPKSCDYFYLAPIHIYKKDCPAAEYLEADSTDLY